MLANKTSGSVSCLYNTCMNVDERECVQISNYSSNSGNDIVNS